MSLCFRAHNVERCNFVTSSTERNGDETLKD